MVVNLQQCVIGNEGKEVMHDVNLQVMQGEFCYVTGRSGAGKSTLSKILGIKLSKLNFKIKIIDGDIFRTKNKNKKNYLFG